MQNIVLIVHLILSLCLIGIVLMQRSEGGGLGIGGGGGGGNSGRPPAGPLAKVTWIIAIGFIITSVSLLVISAREASTDSVIERVGTETQQAPTPAPASSPLGDSLLPPTASDAPATPPKPEE